MTPNNSKLTIHPWLDAPLYNRIHYPQWKIYLYNAAQKLCTPLDPTGAYCLVARDADWEAHPKNITPSRPPTPGSTLHPAVIRVRPIIAMPPFYMRTATTYEREVWKQEKEKFEKFNDAETILRRFTRSCLFIPDVYISKRLFYPPTSSSIPVYRLNGRFEEL